jgi:hypothetical protein
MRKTIIVLGMHRSGTSVLAGALAALGLQLPKRIMRADSHNPKGYFEPEHIVAIHDRLLPLLGTNWHGINEIPASRFETSEIHQFVGELAEAIATDYQSADPILMKDPRLCRLLPLWRLVLAKCNSEAAFVLPIRNPLEVAASLKKRDGFPLEYGQLLWLRHVLDAERETRGSQRIFVHFHGLLRHPVATIEAIAMAFEIGKPTPSQADAINSLVDASLCHFTCDPSDMPSSGALFQWTAQAYQAHTLLIEQGEDSEALRLLDTVRASFDPAVEAFEPMLAWHTQCIDARDQMITAMNQLSAEQERQISGLIEAADRFEERITALTRRAGELEAHVAALSQSRAEQDARIANLTQADEEKEARITTLAQFLAERDEQIVVLTESLTERDKHIADLLQFVAGQSGQIASLSRVASQREARLAGLDAEIDAIRQSMSWQLTAPIRVAGGWYRRWNGG